VPGIALRHRDPAAESERRRCGHAGNRHLHIVSRDVDLEDLILEVALLAEESQYLLIVGGYLLRLCGLADKEQ
jgi:hypothetical protein